MEEPRARVVREEPDRDNITGLADAHDVAKDRVHEVVRGITRTAYNSEPMSMQVNGMLFGDRIGEALSRDASAEYTHRSTDGTSWDG